MTEPATTPPAEVSADALAEPDEATAKAWIVEHLLDDRKMPRPRMAALKAIEDRYPWLKPPNVDVVYRGLRNLTRQVADHRDGLLRPSDPVRDKSWTTSRKAADEYALAEHTIEDREAGRVGAVLEARASADVLLFNAAEMAKVPGIGDVIHPDDGKPLSDMILAESEVVALGSLEVVDVHVLSYDDSEDLPTLDAFTTKLRGISALPAAKRRDRGWTDNAIAGAMALLGSLVVTPQVQADAGSRVYRTCTMDFALGAEDRIAVDRALAIADELGPKTDAVQVNSIAERLRADGFADKVTTDGRLIVTGYAARTGSQLYGDGKSTWYEFRSEDEVEKSLKSFDFATFTDDHPPVLVTSDNWREYARGMLGTGAELLPPDEQGLRFVKVQICVGDIGTIRKMRDGKVQLSTGYTTIAVRDPGVDAQGVRYTYRQTGIEVNHESLVDEARAGPKARVLIDGAFVFEAKEQDMTTKPKNDQMDPDAAMALLDAIKAYAYAESPEAADGAIQAIATALALDPEMVKQALGGGEMMEMDGVKLRVSVDMATRIRSSQAKVHGDAAKLTTDLAAAQGELAGLARTVAKLEADKASADMRELEREIAPLCPQLVSTWSAGKRPDSMTAMRAAAIVDLDATAKVDLDAAMGADPAKPAPTFDAFVSSLYRATIRHASARKANVDGPTLPSFEPKIDTSNVYGKPATN
jgi:hypothetical protein